MSDNNESDHNNESDEEEVKSGFSLSNVLFGNIDKDGCLIDGFFDEVSSVYCYKKS